MRARAPEWRSLARLCRAAVAAAVLAFLVPHGADADLVGHVEERTAVAGRSNDALIEANPLLQHLQNEHPEALPAILERLRTPVASHRRTLAGNAPAPEEQADDAALTENPDLAQLYRESPEAALDLLRLIREAAKKQ